MPLVLWCCRYLERCGLLADGEWEALLPGDRHTTAFWWIQMQVRRLTDEGVVNEIWASTIFGAITAMRAKANDMMSSLDRDLP